MKDKIRILLVDDHNVVREGLKVVIEATEDMEVVGQAENGRQAVALAKKLIPDVIVLDIIMPLLNGVEATRQLMRSLPEPKILVLSTYSEDEQVQQLIEAGASGYVVKQSAARELLAAIRAIHGGGGYLSPAVCKSVMEECRQSLKRKRSEAPQGTRLTSRETEILQLIAEGHANKQIADVLGITVKTVEKHRQELMDKLNIHNIASLTRYAVSHRLIQVPSAPFTPSESPPDS
jgi:DNA-binding NarL/FixJ family response regulator